MTVMKTIITRLLPLLLAALTLTSGADAMPGLSAHHVDKLGLTISAPEQAYVTGSQVSSDFPLLEQYGMTASQLEVKFKQAGIYFNALWFTEDSELNEIIVTMREDEESRSVFDLSKASDFAIEKLMNAYIGYTEGYLGVSSVYTDAESFRAEQALFIKAKGAIIAEDARENHLQYMTIVNGKRYEITLIEHIPPTEERLSVSEGNVRLMDEVMAGLRFDCIENEFVAKNSGFIWIAALGGGAAAMLLIGNIILGIRRRRATARKTGQRGLKGE